MGAALPDAWQAADRRRRERYFHAAGQAVGYRSAGGLRQHRASLPLFPLPKGIKTAPAVWGQTLFGFRLCLGVYRGLGVLIDGLPGHGVKIRAGGLIRCRSLGQFRGGS